MFWCLIQKSGLIQDHVASATMVSFQFLNFCQICNTKNSKQLPQMPQTLSRKYPHQQKHLALASLRAFQLLSLFVWTLTGHQLAARADLVHLICCHRDPDVCIRISLSFLFRCSLNGIKLVLRWCGACFGFSSSMQCSFLLINSSGTVLRQPCRIPLCSL